MTSLTGGCECGDVRYRLDGDPVTTNCCHCRDCQKITGSAFALNAMIEPARVIVTEGVPVRRTLLRGGQGEAHSWRCARCETLLWADHPFFGDAAWFVRAGTLDHAEAVVPDAHYFIRSKHPWVTVPEAVPQYETLPEDGAGDELSPERATRLRAIIDCAGMQPSGG